MAAIQKDSSVEGGFDVIASSRQSDASEDGGGQISRGGGELVDGGAAASEEAGFLNEIGRWIAADGELREDGEPRARIGGATACGQNFLEIAGKVPDRRIDLGESDLHSTSLNGGTSALG